MRWNWTEGGVVVENGRGERPFAMLPATRREIEDWLGRLERIREIYSLLLAAKTSYAQGRADYENACEQLGPLLAEFEKASAISGMVAAEVAAFFDPPTLADFFDGDRPALTQFASEAATRLKPADDGENGG